MGHYMFAALLICMTFTITAEDSAMSGPRLDTTADQNLGARVSCPHPLPKESCAMQRYAISVREEEGVQGFTL